MTIAEALRAGAAQMSRAGIDGAARDARLLLASAIGVDPARISLITEDKLTDAQAARFARMLESRIARQPVAQIIGHRQFWGRDFVVTGDVLDPRPETETLIAAALDAPAPKRVLDLGTGSGILALTLLAEWTDTIAVAVDVSEAALSVATRNADRLGVADRVTFHHGSWFDGLEGQYDLIVSNPPYITSAEMTVLSPEVRNWEPHLALEAGPDGLEAYRAIAAGLDTHLTPGGRALLEHGVGQGPALRDLFAAWNTESLADMDGRDRIVLLQRDD